MHFCAGWPRHPQPCRCCPPPGGSLADHSLLVLQHIVVGGDGRLRLQLLLLQLWTIPCKHRQQEVELERGAGQRRRQPACRQRWRGGGGGRRQASASTSSPPHLHHFLLQLLVLLLAPLESPLEKLCGLGAPLFKPREEPGSAVFVKNGIGEPEPETHRPKEWGYRQDTPRQRERSGPP